MVIINTCFFAFSNGYLTSLAFTFAPQKVSEEMKGKSGSSLSLFLLVGIFTGSLTATFVYQNLLN